MNNAHDTIQMGYEQRVSSIMSKRDALEEALGATAESPSTSPNPLDLLSDSQRIEASFFLLDLTLVVDSSSLAEFIEPREWFYNLTPAQQAQVIEFYRQQHIGGKDRIVLNWYETYGQKGAFRFEKSLTPVASR